MGDALDITLTYPFHQERQLPAHWKERLPGGLGTMDRFQRNTMQVLVMFDPLVVLNSV